jgi:hypothetical protein
VPPYASRVGRRLRAAGAGFRLYGFGWMVQGEEEGSDLRRIVSGDVCHVHLPVESGQGAAGVCVGGCTSAV